LAGSFRDGTSFLGDELLSGKLTTFKNDITDYKKLSSPVNSENLDSELVK
jgi:hypothetical protein